MTTNPNPNPAPDLPAERDATAAAVLPMAGAEDDFATRKVPFHAKRSLRDFSALAMGTITSIFVFAFGGATAQSYGLGVAVAMAVVGLVVGTVVSAIVAWHASGVSMGVDLMTRGAGFGYLGSGLNVLMLGITWIAYAAFETAFIAAAVHTQWPVLPMWLLNLLAAAVIVPLTWKGVGQVAWLQKATVPIFFLGAIYLVVVALGAPAGVPAAGTAVPPSFTWPAFLSALSIPLSIVPILALALGDYGRFIRRSERRVVAPTGAAVMMGLWMLEFVAGAFITAHLGSTNPGEYTVALMGVVGVVWVLFTQLKVQFANFYGGSLSMANFATRLLSVRDLRRPFLVVVAVLAFAAAQLGIAENLSYVAGLLGVVLSSWVSLLFVDFARRRGGRGRFGIGWVEHRRGHLRDWGVPEVGAVVGVSVLGIVLTVLEYPANYYGTVSILLAWVLTPLVATVLRRALPASPVTSQAPPDWRDLPGADDRRSDDPALAVTCGGCGLRTVTLDALTTADGRVLCSGCDAAGAARA